MRPLRVHAFARSFSPRRGLSTSFADLQFLIQLPVRVDPASVCAAAFVAQDARRQVLWARLTVAHRRFGNSALRMRGRRALARHGGAPRVGSGRRLALCEPRAREARSGREQESETGDERHGYAGTMVARGAAGVRSLHVSPPRRRTPDRRPRMFDCLVHYSGNPVIRAQGTFPILPRLAQSCVNAVPAPRWARGGLCLRPLDDLRDRRVAPPPQSLRHAWCRGRLRPQRQRRHRPPARREQSSAWVRSNSEALTFGGRHSSIAIMSAS
jgi:hypothetical protein